MGARSAEQSVIAFWRVNHKMINPEDLFRIPLCETQGVLNSDKTGIITRTESIQRRRKRKQDMLNTTMNIKDGELYVALEGRLDTLTAPGFEKEMETYFGKMNAVTMDFEELEYISSAGLRTILSVQQYMEENGYRDVKVINVNQTVRETFEVTGFMDLIDVE